MLDKVALDREARPISISVAADNARGALGPEETSWGDTLMPMLVGGLMLSVIGFVIALIAR
jgi:uncharacterized protein (DUF2062 family)